MEVPRFPYVTIEVAPDEAEDAGALLFELGAEGVEERDATTLLRAGPGRVLLLGSFANDDDARAAAAELPEAWSPRVDAVVGDAWRDEWKKHFEPFVLAPGLVVRPPWAPRTPEAGEKVLVLEPGRAFGTGLHETTSLVAAALVDHAEDFRGRPVLDVGCGSGILALVALLLGASEAEAIDVDPEAVSVTEENALRNGLASRLRVSGTPLASIARRFAAVVANIEPRTLVDLAPMLIRCVEPGGILVLSGILSPEAGPGQLDAVLRAYDAFAATPEDGSPKFLRDALRRRGEWVALGLRVPTAPGALACRR